MRKKLVTLILGLCFVGLVGGAMSSWRSLLTEYYLFRLACNSEYAWLLVAGDELTSYSADKALRRFLAAAPGREWFIRQLWTHVVDPPLRRAQADGKNAQVGVVFDQGTGKAMTLWKFDDVAKSVIMTPADRGLSRKCFALADRMTCCRIRVPFIAGWSLTVKEPESDEFAALNIVGARFSTIPTNLQRYCVVRRYEDPE